MPAHLLVRQLRFARSEFLRGLDGVSPEDGVKRILPMNCISWAVGHLASQEQRYWVTMAQGLVLAPDLDALVGWGRPASTPPLVEMWAIWRTITQAADRYLDTLTPAILQTHLSWRGEPDEESVGTMLLRNTYHYWFHLGNAYAARELLGHGNLPAFVDDLTPAAYEPEG